MAAGILGNAIGITPSKDVAGNVWFSQLSVLAQRCSADSIGSAAMKASRKGEDLFPAGDQTREAHGVLVGLRTRIAKEEFP